MWPTNRVRTFFFKIEKCIYKTHLQTSHQTCEDLSFGGETDKKSRKIVCEKNAQPFWISVIFISHILFTKPAIGLVIHNKKILFYLYFHRRGCCICVWAHVCIVIVCSCDWKRKRVARQSKQTLFVGGKEVCCNESSHRHNYSRVKPFFSVVMFLFLRIALSRLVYLQNINFAQF